MNTRYRRKKILSQVETGECRFRKRSRPARPMHCREETEPAVGSGGRIERFPRGSGHMNSCLSGVLGSSLVQDKVERAKGGSRNKRSWEGNLESFLGPLGKLYAPQGNAKGSDRPHICSLCLSHRSANTSVNNSSSLSPFP